jgi:ribonuclease P protein component
VNELPRNDERSAGTVRFSRDRRIASRADFRRIQSEGARVTTRHFVLLVAAGPDADAPSRLGLVVTRKVGSAVVRNRIKRVCREAFRLWPDLLPNGTDLVVIARAGAKVERGAVALAAVTLELVQREWADVASTLRRKAAAARAAATRPRSEPGRSARPAQRPR